MCLKQWLKYTLQGLKKLIVVFYQTCQQQKQQLKLQKPENKIEIFEEYHKILYNNKIKFWVFTWSIDMMKADSPGSIFVLALMKTS